MTSIEGGIDPQGDGRSAGAMFKDIARDMEMITRKMTMKRLASLPVRILTETTLVKLEDGYARVVEFADGESLRSVLARARAVWIALGG